MLHILKVVLVVLGACLMTQAQEVSFTVVQVNGAQVILRTEGKCSPGTLINFAGQGSPPKTITLQLLRRRPDGTFVARSVFSDVNLDLLRPGDRGLAATPLYNLAPMTVAITGAPSSFAQKLELALTRDQNIKIVNREHILPDTLVEVSKNQNIYAIKVHSHFGDQVRTGLINLDGTTDEIAEVLRQQARSYFLVNLNNYFWGPPEPWLRILNTDDYKDPERSLIGLGSDLVLAALPRREGYVCVLMPEENGNVVVLYPNERSTPDKKMLAGAQYDIRQFGELPAYLRATSLGYTHVIVIISETPRPIAAFLPRGFAGKLWDYKRQLQISPFRVGPGLFTPSQNQPVENSEVDDLPPETWDIGHFSFYVVTP